ncbi:MAG: hypothetical protein HN348_10850 [Proteobacteria bacterium]|jgi:hypothetical protein|nr:hypothetical protein [Pseudomonadota bacterium]
MPLSAPDAARHYRQRSQQAATAIQWFEDLRTRVESMRTQVETQLTGAVVELAAAYLPSMDGAVLKRAERLTGFRGFSRRDPLTAMAREQAVLNKTVTRITNDDQYKRREYLVGNNGEYTVKLAEVQSMMEPWQLECSKFEDLDGFIELVEVKYDTPEFAEEWWQPRYWKHWANGDRICEELAMADFGDDVLPAYLKVATERNKWRAQEEVVESKIQAVHDLVQQHDQCVERLPRLPGIYLEQCHKVMAGFFGQADMALLESWLDAEPTDDRAVRMALRKVGGLKAKIGYLDEMGKVGIEKQLEDLNLRYHKYSRKVAKYSRPKHRYTTVADRDLDLNFDAKYSKLQTETTRADEMLVRMMAFHEYGRFDLDANEPDQWWYTFTRSKPSRRINPRTRGWFDRHPQDRPQFDLSPDQQAAQAIAVAAMSRDLDDAGYIS